MSYVIEVLENKPIIVAKMKMTIPDYSTDLALMAVNTMKKELVKNGINPTDPAYDFQISFDSKYRIEVIDVEVNVAVDKKGEDYEIITFDEIDEVEKLIRITADKFEDIHIGLAEWMHDNDCEADGPLRTIIHSGTEFIYDCPVKPAEH